MDIRQLLHQIWELRRVPQDPDRHARRLLATPERRRQLLLDNDPRLATLPVCEALVVRCRSLSLEDNAQGYAEAAGAAVAAAEALLPQPAHLDEDLRAEAWGELSNSQRMLGNLAAARSAIEAAERAESRGSCDPLITARILAYRASLARDAGELDDAIEFGLEVIELYELLGEELNAARAQISLAMAYAAFLDYLSAFRHLGQALERPVLVEDPSTLLIAIHNFATYVGEAGNPHQALEIAKMVAPIYRCIPGGVDLEARLVWLQGTAHRRLGRPAKAAQLFRKASAVFLALGRGHDAALATLEAASALIECGDFAQVGDLAQRATRDLLRLGSTSGALAAITVLKNACEASTITAQLVVELQTRLEQKSHTPRSAPSSES